MDSNAEAWRQHGESFDLPGTRQRLRRFVADREWERFHTPKNLAMALAAEAGELLELFQWLSDEESRSVVDLPEDLALVREELADVPLYLIRLADVLGVDLQEAVDLKLEKNARNYPIGEAKGSATKYSRRSTH